MARDELREAVIRYVKRYYKAKKKVPSVRKMCEHLKKENLSRRHFYRIFPSGIREVCKLAAVPVPKERIGRTAKATTVSRGRIQVEKDLSEVEDEQVKRDLAEALEWERRGDKARARLKAKEMKKKTKLEALKSEAELDPKNIPAYVEALDEPYLNQVLDDMRKACKIEKISLKAGCVKAIESWGPSYARSRCDEPKTFENYVGYCLRQWTEEVKMINAWNKYSELTYDCCCSECNVKYEYVDTCTPLNTFKCPKCRETVGYTCPICKEGWSSRVYLEYDPKANTLRCPQCNTSYNVTTPALKKERTAHREELLRQRRELLSR